MKEDLMQKLSVKLKNTPGNASLVSCSVNGLLNKEETLSAVCKVRTDNSPEENQSGNRENTLLVVFVLNRIGKPLMPCSPARAEHLLKKGKAKVVSRLPFTIQLLYGSGSAVQLVTLGIDAGYSHVGFSAVTEKEELIAGEVTLRKDVSKKLTEKSMYRRNRRNRLWYREPRWLNRISSKKEGWLAPSIQQKLESHLRLVGKIKKLLPVFSTVIEVANFDTQKIQNPEISGIEYQQGELLGYEIREYLLDKWKRKCAYCGKKNIPLEIDHIFPKSRGGSNRINNLTLACHKCNHKKGNMTVEEFGYPGIQKKADQTLKATAFMNTIRWKIVNQLNCEHTYGYITKHNRIKAGLEKSHSNDAFVIAGGNCQLRVLPFAVTQKRKNNRSLQLNRKGFKLSIRKQRYSIQPNDLAKIENRWLETTGSHCKGTRIIVNKKSINIKNVESVFNTGTLIWRQAIPPTAEAAGFLA